MIIEILDAAKNLEPTGDADLDRVFGEHVRSGFSPPGDQPLYYRFLYQLSRRLPGLSMVELGFRDGFASLHFLRGGGGRVVGIDMKCRNDAALFAGYDCRTFDISSTNDLGPKHLEDGVDILFVDTDHSYQATRAEFELWKPSVKSGGAVMFDDIASHFGCTQFWKELPGHKLELNHLHPGWGFGVYLVP